jgi:hypothetical protein
MCLDVTGFTKDDMNARKDLDALCNCPAQEAKPNARGKLGRPKKSILFEADRKESGT